MKKLLLSVIILLSVNVVFAQFEKKIASSDRDIENPKKNMNSKTWLDRAELFQKVYGEPLKGITSRMPREMLEIKLSDQKVLEEGKATIGGVEYVVVVYPDKKLYYHPNGVLEFWELTIDTKDPLVISYQAYQKAIELDKKKGEGNDKIIIGLKNLGIQLNTEASNLYEMEQYDKAYEYMKLSVESTSNPVVNTIDTAAIYNYAIIANVAKQPQIAIDNFKKVIDLGFTNEGDAYLRLAAIYGEQGRKNEQLKTLEDGMKANPDNNQLILSLIDYYRFAGEDPKKILPLIDQAKAADPENPGLLYAEGSLYEKIAETTKDPKDFEKAVASYKKSTELKPDYVFGYYGLGAMYFNQGAIYNNEAIEVPINETEKYNQLVKLADEQFELALPLMLKAYELKPDERAIVESLKDIYMRFRTKSPEYQAEFEKYNDLLQNM